MVCKGTDSVSAADMTSWLFQHLLEELNDPKKQVRGLQCSSVEKKPFIFFQLQGSVSFTKNVCF